MRLAFIAPTFGATLVACGAPATLTEQQQRAIAAERGIAVPVATVQAGTVRADSVRADSLTADDVRRLVADVTRAGEERAVERARVATGRAFVGIALSVVIVTTVARLIIGAGSD